MGAAADFAHGDRIPDFLLGNVGVEWHLGAIEHGEQLGLAQFQPDEGFIEVGMAPSSWRRTGCRRRPAQVCLCNDDAP